MIKALVAFLFFSSNFSHTSDNDYVALNNNSLDYQIIKEFTIRCYSIPNMTVDNMAINKTGKKLILYSPTILRTILYDIENENYLTLRNSQTSILFGFSYDDTKIISLINDSTIKYSIYDAHTGDILITKFDYMISRKDGYKPISISSDPNKFMVNYANGCVRAFDLSTLDELELSYEEIKNSQMPPISICQSENGMKIINKEHKIITLPVISDPINCICINQDNSIIATGHPQGKVRIWSA